jgi:tetratricopeptide (TPR) repeat protein
VRLRLVIALAALLAVPAAARAGDILEQARANESAIEERIRLVLIHRLEEQAVVLDGDVAALEREDKDRRAAGLAPTGLTDDVRYLAAGLLPTRDSQREALKDVLRERPDPIIKHLAEHRLEEDDAAKADQLLVDDRHNRRVTVLNEAVRPLGIFSGAAIAAVINPFMLAGSAADSIITTAVNLWNYNRLSTPEREALARYRSLLEREPRTRDAPEIAQAMRRLGTKRAAALCADTIRLGKKALDDHDLNHATYYLRSAGQIDGCQGKADDLLDDLKEARAVKAAHEEAATWPVDDPPQPSSTPELDDYHALLVATALADPGQMIEAASRFRERHEDSPFLPSARYAIAVARHLGGHADEGRAALAALAEDDDSSAGRHAAAILASADYSRLDAIGDAERQHGRNVVRYVLLGGRMDGRTALYSAAQFGAEGIHAAQSFGIFNVIGVATRAWQSWRKDPVSNQTIIDRGEEFLAREPNSPQAADVHARLADAYERAGTYDRALLHYRSTPDPSQKRITKLESAMADHLLEEAEKDSNNPVLLSGIVDHYPTTDAADKARKRLADRPADGELTLDRELLLAHPALLAPDALDIDARLLDGDRDNGELADGGVVLVNGEMRLTLRADGDDRVDTRTLDPDAYRRARGAAQEALYSKLLTADRRDPETGKYERYVPFFLQGTVEDSGGVYVYPGVKMRRYRSEDHSLYE